MIPPKGFNKRWNHSIWAQGKDYEQQSWKYQSLYHPEINFEYRSRTYDGEASIIIKITSVARLAFGNNHTPFRSVEDAVKVIATAIADDPNVPKLGDISSARLIRVDFFVDNPIGDKSIVNVLNFLSSSEYPRRDRITYRNTTAGHRSKTLNNGVVFKNTIRTSRFYDKHQQSPFPETVGLLRHEIQLSTSGECNRVFKTSAATLSSLTEEQVEFLFRKDLMALHLDDAVITVNQAESLLVEKFGRSKAINLLDLLRFKQDHPELTVAQIADRRGRTRDYVRRQISEIESAGVSPVFVIEKLPVMRTTPILRKNAASSQ
jgi:hypothetical protein